MTPRVFLTTAIDPALALLPAAMDSVDARAMLLAIALQESLLRARTQLKNGPAHSYYQFEPGGILGVLRHEASREAAHSFCLLFDVEPKPSLIAEAITYNDVLATIFARLLLWTLPEALPRRHEESIGWMQYQAAWRPGQPRPADWPGNFREAWSVFPTTVAPTEVKAEV